MENKMFQTSEIRSSYDESLFCILCTSSFKGLPNGHPWAFMEKMTHQKMISSNPKSSNPTRVASAIRAGRELPFFKVGLMSDDIFPSDACSVQTNSWICFVGQAYTGNRRKYAYPERSLGKVWFIRLLDSIAFSHICFLAELHVYKWQSTRG